MNYKDFNWQNEKILVADDDIYTAILLEKIMKKVGVQVILARDGEEALHKLISDNDITIAVLDILMPKLTGLEVVQKFRLIRSNIIFIAFTADIVRIDKKKCCEMGFYTCLSKPVFPLKLLNTIDEAIFARSQPVKSS